MEIQISVLYFPIMRTCPKLKQCAGINSGLEGEITWMSLPTNSNHDFEAGDGCANSFDAFFGEVDFRTRNSQSSRFFKILKAIEKRLVSRTCQSTS